MFVTTPRLNSALESITEVEGCAGGNLPEQNRPEERRQCEGSASDFGNLN